MSTKKFFPTSKKLTWLVTGAWLFMIVLSSALKIFSDKDLTSILEYVHSAFVFVLGFYFAKSSIESVVTSKGSISATTDSTTTTIVPSTTTDETTYGSTKKG